MANTVCFSSEAPESLKVTTAGSASESGRLVGVAGAPVRGARFCWLFFDQGKNGASGACADYHPIDASCHVGEIQNGVGLKSVVAHVKSAVMVNDAYPGLRILYAGDMK